MSIYQQEKTFERVDYATTMLPKGEYEHCTFSHCNFANTNLSGYIFIDCTFIECNMSMVKLNQTALRTAHFKHCKLLGVHFYLCHEFLLSLSFDNCILNLASFYKLQLKKTKFKNCSLHEADFTESNLTEALFEECDLHLATFDRTILEKADLRKAFNYTIRPENNQIKKAKFSQSGISGLLQHFDIQIS